MSHVDSYKITKFAGYISSIYGVLTVYRGEVYDYFVMDLDYSKQVTVKIFIIKYLDSVLK